MSQNNVSWIQSQWGHVPAEDEGWGFLRMEMEKCKGQGCGKEHAVRCTAEAGPEALRLSAKWQVQTWVCGGGVCWTQPHRAVYELLLCCAHQTQLIFNYLLWWLRLGCNLKIDFPGQRQSYRKGLLAELSCAEVRAAAPEQHVPREERWQIHPGPANLCGCYYQLKCMFFPVAQTCSQKTFKIALFPAKLLCQALFLILGLNWTRMC